MQLCGRLRIRLKQIVSDTHTCSVEQGFEMGRQLALRLMEMISTGECDDRNYTYVMKPILYDGHSIRKIQKAK